jgi:MFS family permease
MSVAAQPLGDDRPVTRYAWYALGVMTIVHMLSFIDRQILSILAEQIREDLGLTDAQLGFLYGTAFAVFYTLFGIPLGRLADRWRRGRLMAIGLALWSAMTALSGFATSYAFLAIARLGVGVGEASASPAAFSMQADLFPKGLRGRANAIYSAGVYLGMGFSLPLGGAISQGWDRAYGDKAPLGLAGWQAAFIGVGLPGLLVAAWVWSLREPQRLGVHGEPLPASYDGAWRSFVDELFALIPPLTLWSVSRYRGELSRNILIMAGLAAATTLLVLWSGDIAQWSVVGVAVYAVASWIQVLRLRDPPTFRLIWATPELVLALIGFGSLALITYSVGFWAAPYAIRTFHLSAPEVGLAIGIPAAVASGLGVLLGGWLSDVWRRRNPRGRIYACMLAPLITAPLLVAQYLAPDFMTFAVLSPLVYAATSMYLGSAIAALQELVLPRMYGTLSATYIMGNTLIGLCLGPYGTGKIATVTGDLRLGVLSALAAAPIALVCLWRVSRRAGWLEESKRERAQSAGEDVTLDPRVSTARPA